MIYHRVSFGLLCLLALGMAAFATECTNPWEMVEISNGTFLPDGSAWDPAEGTLYPKGAHWKQEWKNGTYMVFGCPCRLGKPCMRKCCTKHQAMDNNTLECFPYDESWPWFRPTVPVDEDGNMTEVAQDHFALTYGVFCPVLDRIVGEPRFYPEKDMFYVDLKNGEVNLFQRNRFGMWVDEICLEYFPSTDEYLPIWCYGTQKKNKMTVVERGICYHVRYKVYPAAFSVSVFFLLVSLIVHCALPELRNVHGKCLICYMLSLLVAYIGLAAVQGLGNSFNHGTCVTFGFIIYFALFCTFFWLNILCIDLFLAFRGMQPTIRGSQQRKFFCYMAYAWGLPLFILMITIFLEFYPQLPEWVLRPKFEGNCWITEASKWAYFILPMGIIVSCNSVLFLITAFTISKVRKETEVLRKGESKKHHRGRSQREDNDRFKLYIKLSVIMGINWISEIVSFAVGGSDCYWYATDLFNILQGVFIFFITTCKKKVMKLIVKRVFPSMVRERLSFLQSTSSSGRSSTSTTKV